MIGQYILDGKNPVLATDYLSWAMWIENADRVVKKTSITDGVEVSTVFLGLDHSFLNSGSPILFETMIFGGERDQEQWRYSTWEEAETGHDKVVAELESSSKGRC